jgi:hypothetical protein
MSPRLALELSRNHDGTIAMDKFEHNCEIAFNALTRFEKDLDDFHSIDQQETE